MGLIPFLLYHSAIFFFFFLEGGLGRLHRGVDCWYLHGIFSARAVVWFGVYCRLAFDTEYFWFVKQFFYTRNCGWVRLRVCKDDYRDLRRRLFLV